METVVKVLDQRLNDMLVSGVAQEARFIGTGGVPYTVVPEEAKVSSLERFMAVPARKRAAVVVRDAASLIAYMGAHDEERTATFAELEKLRIEAILDYHRADAPGFGEHRVLLQLVERPEWTTWMGKNKRPMTQAEFAQFIEDNLPDIAEPQGATVLEIARSLEARKKVNFLSSVRLRDGNREFTYEEQTESSAAKGKLAVPETFTLGLQPFAGAEKYRIEARLRYRISDDGKLTLWYDLVRPHLVLEAAFEDTVKLVASSTKSTILAGSVTVPPCGD